MSAHTSTIVDSTADNPIIDMTWHQAATPKERARAGLDARERAPLESHAIWHVHPDRREVIGLLEEQSKTRLQSLIPLRYYRMSDSAFTFYRGTALIMANDLARTPVTGIPVQAVGDAHIGHFGSVDQCCALHIDRVIAVCPQFQQCVRRTVFVDTLFPHVASHYR